MYATVTRRRSNAARAQEIRDRAEREFFPELRQAPGFISFTLFEGQDGVNTVITLWESKTQAEAFGGSAARVEWARVVDELGHEAELQDRGEVLQHFGAGVKATA